TYFGERALRSEAGGVTRVSDGDLPEPVSIRTGQVGPDTEGSLVQLKGEVVGSSKPGVRLDDGSEEARARVADTTGIAWPSPRKGDTLTVIGVVSSFNGSFRGLPRVASDLALQREPEPTSSPAPTATPEPPDGGDPDPTATPELPTVQIPSHDRSPMELRSYRRLSHGAVASRWPRQALCMTTPPAYSSWSSTRRRRIGQASAACRGRCGSTTASERCGP
ncbi:MAG: hypothetical protein WKH64_17215, partial [Chloroflexia bacterium]